MPRLRSRRTVRIPVAPAVNFDTLDDLELVGLSRLDPQIFGVLYERYRQTIYVYCFRRLGSPERADDATSTIFIKAFAALENYRPKSATSGSTFRSWMFSIAHNVLIDVWRKDRHPVSLDAFDEEVFANFLIDPAHSPEAIAIGAEESRGVQSLLAQLPERQRAAVELRLSGLTTVEVAQVLGMTVAASKSLQFRAYRILRDLLRSQSETRTLEAHK